MKPLSLVLGILALAGSVRAQYTAPPPQSKTSVALAELYERHFWTGSTYSLKDDANHQAVIAFQKLVGLPRSGKLTDATIEKIGRFKVPTAHDSMHRYHIEVDLNHQVLFVFDSIDRLEHILSISSGNGKEFDFPNKGKEFARTPRGKFRVFYKVTGWKKSPLGMMFDPMYFDGGFAVHGSQSVPPQPASHGCVRIPMFAASEMFRTTPIGTPVLVFGENPRPPKS